METAILVILNVVLLVLAIVAFRLIRSGRPTRILDESTPARKRGRDSASSPVLGPSDPVTPQTVTEPVTTEPVTTESTAIASVVPIPRSQPELTPVALSDYGRTGRQAAVVERRSDGKTGEGRSVITIATLPVAGAPNRSELLCGIVHSLGKLGLSPARSGHELGRMVTRNGRSAMVRVGHRGGGELVEIAIDSSLAIEAVALLELWKREAARQSDDPKSERVLLSARIR